MESVTFQIKIPKKWKCPKGHEIEEREFTINTFCPVSIFLGIYKDKSVEASNLCPWCVKEFLETNISTMVEQEVE